MSKKKRNHVYKKNEGNKKLKQVMTQTYANPHGNHYPKTT